MSFDLQVLVEVDEVLAALVGEDRIGVSDARGCRIGDGRRARLGVHAQGARRGGRAGAAAVADHGRLRPHAGRGAGERDARRGKSVARCMLIAGS